MGMFDQVYALVKITKGGSVISVAEHDVEGYIADGWKVSGDQSVEPAPVASEPEMDEAAIRAAAAEAGIPNADTAAVSRLRAALKKG